MNYFRLPFLKSVIIASAMVSVCVAGPVLAKDPVAVLKQLDGSWKGRGLGRQSLESGTEKALCQIRSEFDEATSVLTTSGHCATAKAKIKIHGELKYHAETESYIGDLFSRFGDDGGKTTSNGKLVGKSIVLKTTNSDDLGKIRYRGRVTITPLNSKRYKVASKLTDVAAEKSFEAAELIFTKK